MVVWSSIFSYSSLYILESISTLWRVWGENQVAGFYMIDKLQSLPKYLAQSTETSKIGHDFKNVISNFACFLTAIVTV